ncbi:hypothetical protein CXB51_025765 [Gossypium anomalum]|uniref:CRM domain-containing protein n=1 Tax=Gossypium anomalum TaxID=47600 RepID=A0A8J6CRU8_9ROSI|nr:hypothetical protein CXB51_025765 [Gossypium anomalum]
MTLFHPTTTTKATLLDSFQTSLSRFHGLPLPFFRYSSFHFPLKTLNFCANNHTVTSNSQIHPNPESKTKAFPTFSSNWLDNWDKTHKRNGPKLPKTVFNYRKDGNLWSLSYSKSDNNGSGSSSTMEKLKKFGYIGEENEQKEEQPRKVIERGSIEDIFYVEKGMWVSKESPLAMETEFGSDVEKMFPWEKRKEEQEEGKWTARGDNKASLAELTLPESEFRTLRNLTFRTESKMRIKGAGVTQEVVDTIHEKWKTMEIVRLKVEGATALNMKRIHEILERKTGGLVIWRSGTSISLYREPLPEIKYEDEVDKLLEGLGPRYADWLGCDPLPVDADLLPGIVPRYQPPFRVLPYGVRSSLGVKEATSLRRLARVLPPHFFLGRSRQLQGLALAMTKLWEKSSIAKIALKRGVQLTTSERMAEDLKVIKLHLLKNFPILFLCGLSMSLSFELFRESIFAFCILLDYGAFFSLETKTSWSSTGERTFCLQMLLKHYWKGKIGQVPARCGGAGTVKSVSFLSNQELQVPSEKLWMQMLDGEEVDDHHKEKVLKEAEILRHANLVRKLEKNLAFAERKLLKAERALSKVEDYLKPADWQADPENITDEERFIRMKAFLLLEFKILMGIEFLASGRRGVFDGTIENMHLHWKYRELVKIIMKAKNFDQVKKVAIALEAESGGVLVSVDKISKGYAIIVYQGKDYERPSTTRPKNLLTKRRALARSIELQRREDQMHSMDARGDEEFYDRLDSSYPSDDDDDTEEEGDEAYLGTYDGENDGEENDDLHLETNFPFHNQHQES